MKSVNPYLNFYGNTKEAFEFYKSVFGGEFLGIIRFEDMPGMPGVDEMSEADRNKLMHIALPIGKNNILMGTDVLESFSRPLDFGNNQYINIEADSAEEADQLFDALSEGGKIEMQLQQTPWAEKYGSCVDKFGVQWMVNYTGKVQFSA
ncbi:MAG TPA: VOC family protein [Balneolales bacterium]|nr:VOC family protein [Balneolales bacterium]